MSINVVSESTPPSVPKHNADIIYAWCYSYMYHHKTDSECFQVAGTINTMIANNKPSEMLENTIQLMFKNVLNLQFTKANDTRV